VDTHAGKWGAFLFMKGDVIGEEREVRRGREKRRAAAKSGQKLLNSVGFDTKENVSQEEMIASPLKERRPRDY